MTAPELMDILSAMLEDGKLSEHENLLVTLENDLETYRLKDVISGRFGIELVATREH